MIDSPKERVVKDQGEFRSGRGYVDQLFVLKQLVEKYREKRKELYAAFMYLQKVYDKVCGEGLWKVLHEYGVKDYFVRSMSNLYEWSEECGIFGNRIGEW